MVIDRTQPDWASTDSVRHSRLLVPDAEVTDGSGFGKSLTRVFSGSTTVPGQVEPETSWMVRTSPVTGGSDDYALCLKDSTRCADVADVRHHHVMSAAAGLERCAQHHPAPQLGSEPGVPGSHRGILARPDALTFTLRRVDAAADLAWCVEHYWIVEWHRPEANPGEGRVLPHPCVNVGLDEGRLNAHGVATEVFVRRLVGSGRVFGIRFRPGGFRPFVDRSVSMLTDRVRPAGSMMPGAAALASALLGGTDNDQVAATESFLRSRSVDPEPRALLVNAVTDALVGDSTVTRVAQVHEMFDVGERALQRTFADYLGVTPRWVLRRARLHLAAERVIELATSDTPGDWADVAVDLGYVDQAHFIHDFKAVIGETPARWAASLGR